MDEEPQNEVTISRRNDVLSFSGKFVYAASDNVIAYPGRNVDYKYGGSTYFIIYKNIEDPSKNTGFNVSTSVSKTTTISDAAIYIQTSNDKARYEKYPIPKKTIYPEWIDASEVSFDNVSQDDSFHCNDNIKPRSVKFIEN
ncbi:hypothetical protein ABOC21_09960 [Klebsiella sp. WOUb02]